MDEKTIRDLKRKVGKIADNLEYIAVLLKDLRIYLKKIE